jgi:TPR repeat protein
MIPGVAIAVMAASKWVVRKTAEVLRPSPTREERTQAERHVAAMRQMKAQATQEQSAREAQLEEQRRKGLILSPEQAAALYRKGMDYWHGTFLTRQDRTKAAELIRQAARNGDENARMMANMNGWPY